ncbi:hypothetical protein [Streptomyces alfalfae]
MIRPEQRRHLTPHDRVHRPLQLDERPPAQAYLGVGRAGGPQHAVHGGLHLVDEVVPVVCVPELLDAAVAHRPDKNHDTHPPGHPDRYISQPVDERDQEHKRQEGCGAATLPGLDEALTQGVAAGRPAAQIEIGGIGPQHLGDDPGLVEGLPQVLGRDLRPVQVQIRPDLRVLG